MMPSNRRATLGPARRGGVYVLILTLTSVLLAASIGALLTLRVQQRIVASNADAAQARMLAVSAIEIGLQRIADNANTWRSTVPGDGKWFTNLTLGGGRVELRVTDPVDGNLTNKADDPVVLTGVGIEPSAKQLVQVSLDARYSPMTCLTTAFCAADQITFQGTTTWGTGPLVSNVGLTALLANVATDCETTALLPLGLTFSGGMAVSQPARQMPTSASIDSYRTAAVAININSIPSRRIEKVVLSPGNNPYGGATHPSGYYYVNGGGQSLELRDCRILGTLIVSNCPQLRVRGSVLIEPVVAGYPSLLVVGNAALDFDLMPLSESSVGANFNPSHTPYGGQSDADTSDSYPSLIRGIFYATGNVTGTSMRFDGVALVGGVAILTSDLQTTFNPASAAALPPGFIVNPRMVVTPGTWTRIVE